MVRTLIISCIKTHTHTQTLFRTFEGKEEERGKKEQREREGYGGVRE